MATRDILYAAAGGGAAPTYIEDVFSTWLYTGNGTSQTINNGIDLAGKGGMVWIKNRVNTFPNALFDTVRGATKYVVSNTTAAEVTNANTLTSFNSNGFSLGNSTIVNNSSESICSWTFGEAPKFFDIVTYTGNGTARTVAHNLGSVPGMIIIKRLDDINNGVVYHRSLTSASYFLILNSTAAESNSSDMWNNTAPTSSVFSLGTAATNTNGGTYVAYLFAHNAGGFGLSGNDNVISCGSFTTAPGTGDATVNLGYEPQYILTKSSSTAGQWNVIDVMRGMSNTGMSRLFANTSGAETSFTTPYVVPTATGFNVVNGFFGDNTTIIYMAIRRGPMATPTSGTQVFMPTTWSGTNADNRYFNTGLLTDWFFYAVRNAIYGNVMFDRLRGNDAYFYNTANTNAEGFVADFLSFTKQQTGVTAGFAGYGLINQTGYDNVGWSFRRAPGFFDVVCYTGDGAARTVAHNLGVAPELMIVKARSATGNWRVYNSTLGNTSTILFNFGNAVLTGVTNWNSTSPTASVFSLSDDAVVNNTGTTYVAYLFASVAGVSKVGSYTGTGATLTINAGLPTGARFVLIKRTDSTGNWWVWDTARGMVAGTDPRLALNTTDAELNNNWVYTVTNGFQIVTSDATINASGGSYIYLAIA